MKHDDLLPYLYDQYLCSKQVSLDSSRLAIEILNTCLDTMSKTYIIIDGLDECDIVERKMILSLFTSLAAKDIASGRLKCLFISQDENDIRKLLKTSSILKLTGAHNKSDIEAYTTYWLEKSKRSLRKFQMSL